MASHFGDRLCDAVRTKKTPLIVGIDPVYSRLPEAIRSHRQMNDESDAAAAVDAIFDYCTQVMRIVAPMVPAVKINVAFFERYLWEGLETYYNLVAEAEELGLEVIGDIKRGDIGHTAESYAAAHLENSELIGFEDMVAPDAVTVNGYLGADGIEPFAATATEQGKGVFVLVRTSNPSAASIQDFADTEGTRLYEKVAEVVSDLANAPGRVGASGFSNIGMVIGGTSAEVTSGLRRKYPNMWILVPGYGSQGATAADCIKFCRPDGAGALVNASRSIIYAYERPRYREQYGSDWKRCVEQAVIDAKVELSQALQAMV